MTRNRRRTKRISGGYLHSWPPHRPAGFAAQRLRALPSPKLRAGEQGKWQKLMSNRSGVGASAVEQERPSSWRLRAEWLQDGKNADAQPWPRLRSEGSKDDDEREKEVRLRLSKVM